MSTFRDTVTRTGARSLTRRQLVNRTAGAGAAAIAAGALGGSHAAAQDREPTTVEIWTWRDVDVPVWEAAAEALQETWPGLAVNVEVSDATEFETMVATAMQGGQGPDIITTRAGGAYFQPYAEAEMFVPLTDKVPDLANIPAGTISQMSYNDQVLAIPFASQVWLVYYNTAIFAEHNLQPPATWGDFIGILDTLKETDVTPLFVPVREGWILSGWVDCIGATYLGDEYAGQLISGEKTFTDERFVSLLTRIKDLQPYFQDGYVGNNVDDMDAAFQSGRAAMVIYGGWAARTYGQVAPDLEFDFFIAPPDEAGGQQYSYVFADGGYAVNAASDQQDAALELVKYSATVDYGQTFSDLTGEMSSIPGVTAGEDNLHLQRQLEFAELQLTNLFRIRSPMDQGDPSLSTLLHPLMQGILGDQISPEDAAAQLQEGLEQWYEPYQGE